MTHNKRDTFTEVGEQLLTAFSNIIVLYIMSMFNKLFVQRTMFIKFWGMEQVFGNYIIRDI